MDYKRVEESTSVRLEYLLVFQDSDPKVELYKSTQKLDNVPREG